MPPTVHQAALAIRALLARWRQQSAAIFVGEEREEGREVGKIYGVITSESGTEWQVWLCSDMADRERLPRKGIEQNCIFFSLAETAVLIKQLWFTQVPIASVNGRLGWPKWLERNFTPRERRISVKKKFVDSVNVRELKSEIIIR